MTLRQLVFPGLLVAINLGAALVEALAGEWKKAVYFVASGVCIAAVAIK